MAGTTRLELATSAVTVSHWKYIIGNVNVYRDVYRGAQHRCSGKQFASGPPEELGWEHFQSRCAATGLLVWSYTSRTALIRVSGSSNWMYSELLWAKICFALEDSSSQRVWAR